MMLIAAFVSTVFLYSLISQRLERTVLTAPIVFTLAGIFVYGLPPEFTNQKGSSPGSAGEAAVV